MNTMAHLLASTVSLPVQALLVLSVCVTSAWRIWVSYRKTLIQEKERTSRLMQSIAGAEPPERPEIIRACSLLESRAVAGQAEPDPPATK
jgi:hypothetical protein